MSRKVLAILIVVCCFPVLAKADLTTGNQFVCAKVSSGWGLVTWYNGDIKKSPLTWKILSFVDHSFLDLRIGNTFFTNDNLSPPPTLTGPPQVGGTPPDFFLDNGVNRKIGDTIETVWAQEGFDIVQDVYPVAFSRAGQIIVKIKIVNHSNAAVNNVQVNYLLDIDPQNDKAKILTRWGYAPNWTQFPNGVQNIPPFFMASQNSPDKPGFPGLTGTSYVNDSMAPRPLGLLQPSSLVVGDWTVLSFFKFGFDGPWNQDYGDNAVVYQWPLTKAPAKTPLDSVTTIASLSYGTGEFCDNFGATVPIYAMIMRPGQLNYDAKSRSYSPNPFPVTALIFNLSTTTALGNVQATLTVGGSLRILPTNVQSRKQGTTIGSQIQPLQVGDTVWLVKTNDITNFIGDSLASLSLDVNGIPWANDWPDNCDRIHIPAATSDTTAANSHLFPKDSIVSRTGSYDGSNCNAHCSEVIAVDPRFCALCGISGVHMDAVSNMTVTVQDSFSSRFSACVVDSMQNGFANVIVSDLDGSRDTVRFTYCTIADRLAPLIIPGECKQGLCFSVEEKRPWDRRIDLLKITNVSNFNLSFNPPSGSWHGQQSILVTGIQIDYTQPSQFCLEAIDLAGNKLDTCFSIPVSGGVETESQTPISITVIPNPSHGPLTISITENRSAMIEVLDVLGRTLDHFTLMGSKEYDLSRLSDGAYLLRAESNGTVITKRLVKQ
jgi:hypothetical protein